VKGGWAAPDAPYNLYMKDRVGEAMPSGMLITWLTLPLLPESARAKEK